MKKICETDCIIRYKHTYTTYTENTSPANPYFVMSLSSDGAALGETPTQEHISTWLESYSGCAHCDYWSLASGVNTNTKTIPHTGVAGEVGTKYVELIRSNTLTLTLNVYSDSSYSTLLGTEQNTMATGINNLQYLKFHTTTLGGVNNGVFVGSVDDIQFWDDVTTVPVTPDAPTNLIATSGNSQVSLTWIAPANDGGSSIIDYKIEYGNGTTWTVFNDGVSTAITGTVTGLTNESTVFIPGFC